MMKEHKGKLLLSSAIILLPILMGNVAMTIFILIGHWICLFFTFSDSKNKNQNQKVWNMIFWICPCISLFANGISYILLSDTTIEMENITPAFFGLLFVLIGNYLPKCRQNSTIGIKLSWTLNNEENWNQTHRIGGKTWVFSGFLMLCSLFLPENFKITIFIIALILALVVPMLYSYLYSIKQKANGTYSASIEKTPANKISAVIAAILLIASAALITTGDITFEYNEDKLIVDSTYWNSLKIDYASIDSISYMENIDAGSREFGFGSLRLLMGAFQNDAFGNYTRYSYTNCDSCVVLDVSGKTIVLGAETEEDTLEIYEKLKEKSGL